MKYNIYWKRVGEKESHVCRGLDPRTIVARLIQATKENDITIYKIENE